MAYIKTIFNKYDESKTEQENINMNAVISSSELNKFSDGIENAHTLIDEVKQEVQNIQLIAGPKGDKGDTGDTGMPGAMGSKGNKGDTGATGNQGAAGETIKNITIVLDEQGHLFSGEATLTDDSKIPITITTKTL